MPATRHASPTGVVSRNPTARGLDGGDEEGEPHRCGGQDRGGGAGLGRQRPHLGSELVALPERRRHAVDGPRHLAAAAGSDREGRRHHLHVVGRVASTPTTPPGRRRPGRRARSGRRSRGARRRGVRRPRGPARPAPVRRHRRRARADASRSRASGSCRSRRRRRTAGRARSSASTQPRAARADRAFRGAWRRAAAPGRVAWTARTRAATATAASRAVMCTTRVGRRDSRSTGSAEREVVEAGRSGEEPDARSVGRAGRSPRRRRRPIAPPRRFERPARRGRAPS